MFFYRFCIFYFFPYLVKEAFTYFKIDIHNSIKNKTFDDVMAFTLLHFVELNLKIQRLDFLMFHLSNFRTLYAIPKKNS
jgi:hypothetical protein